MFNLTIDFDSANEVTRQVLIEALKTIEWGNNPDDVPLWDAMVEVIAYFSTPKQLEEMELREVSSDWMKTVIMHDVEKALA